MCDGPPVLGYNQNGVTKENKGYDQFQFILQKV